MDPITIAIVAAVGVGAAAGAGKVAEKVIVDAYDGLKALIKRKLGADNKVSPAIAELEAEPDFEPNKAALKGRVEQAKVAEDPEIKAAAQALLDHLKGSTLIDIDLSGANLRNVNLEQANLNGANLYGTILLGANLKEADLTGVRYDSHTIWPDGFNPG